MNTGRKLGKRILSYILCMALVLSGLMVPAKQVKAETVKIIAGLGTSMIKDPSVPTKNSTVWTGDYVYFGIYEGMLVKYRVLDACTTDYSADGKTQTMLLDCNRVLYNTQFDEDGKSNADGKNINDWSVSDINSSLNGSDFLEKAGVFTDAERDAIAESTIGSHPLTTDGTTGVAVTEEMQETYENYVALTEDKVFLLDVEDVCNEAYGYTMGYYDDVYRVLRGTGVRAKKDRSNLESSYWLRSARENVDVGSVYATKDSDMYNDIGRYSANYATPPGVSPAFNVDLDSVLFSSVVSETNSNGGTSYKLTLIDSKMTIAAKGVTKSGNTITIPYTLGGSNKANATQVSVLVLDKKYTAGNTNKANILDYQNFSVNGSSVTYTLPSALSGKTAGSDYYIYLLAEDVNGDRENDYASTPVELRLWEAPTVKTMNLGTQGIVEPAAPNHPRDEWKGCHVYFGKYSGSPVKYRVLNPCTTDYSADKMTQTMLLDCDSILYTGSFDTSSNNTWKNSQIYNSLNGADFLNKEGVFTAVEKNAIAASTIGQHALTSDSETGVNVPSGIQGAFKNFIALTGEKIFLLDVEDVSNGAYGYTMTSDSNYDNENRMKTSGADAKAWFLRSADKNSFSKFGIMGDTGCINSAFLNNETVGVSPALNLNLSSVLFTSAGTVSKTAALTSGSTKIGTTTNTDWKLTLKDSGKSVALTPGRSATKAGDGTITVPYTYADSAASDSEKVNQISVMITDKTYGSEGAQILYYGALQGVTKEAGVMTSAGTGTFALPSGLSGTCGTDYHIYLLAEHVNGGNNTDFASEPVEIEVKTSIDTVALPSITVPVAEQPFATKLTVSSKGVAAAAGLAWKKNGIDVIGNAELNTTYQVFMTLTAEPGYAFTDSTGVRLNGTSVESGKITLNENGTLTIDCGEYKTSARKITKVDAPTVPAQFANYYTAENVLSSAELGATAKVTLEGTTQPNPKDMKVKWTLANGNGLAYNADPSATNTFKWTVVASEYAAYDLNGKVPEGTVTIQNKASAKATVGSSQVFVRDDGTATYMAPADKKQTKVTIPKTVVVRGITYKVTDISDTAFAGNKNLTSVTIGDNVTGFSAKTFKGCTNIKTLVIGNGVKKIPANAFKNFKKLTTVKMGSGVKTIEKNAFYGCLKLKSVTIGKNVVTIGDKVFYKCIALTKISIPSKVKTIGKSAFYSCKKLESVTIGKSVAKIGSKAFYKCTKLKNLTIKSTKLTAKKIGSKAFTKTPKSMTVKVPKKKFKTYKSMLTKRGVNKKAKFKKN